MFLPDSYNHLPGNYFFIFIAIVAEKLLKKQLFKGRQALSQKQGGGGKRPDVNAPSGGPEKRSDNPPIDNTNDIIFARRIRVLRRVLGISAAELDGRAGFGAGTIGRMERSDQRIYASHLYRIGEIAGVGVDYFYIGLSDDASNEDVTKAEVEYLMNCLEIAGNGNIRGDAKIVAEIIARELTANTEQEPK